MIFDALYGWICGESPNNEGTCSVAGIDLHSIFGGLITATEALFGYGLIAIFTWVPIVGGLIVICWIFVSISKRRSTRKPDFSEG